MPTSRSYGDACGIARALDVVGERWALLVARELLLGPQRFTDLRRALPAASSNLVADRLRELEGHGVIRRRKLPPPAGSQVYELTAWGHELEPILVACGSENSPASSASAPGPSGTTTASACWPSPRARRTATASTRCGTRSSWPARASYRRLTSRPPLDDLHTTLRGYGRAVRA